MGSYKSRILLELKRKGYLLTDEGRLTKKLQLENIRQSIYQIARKIFKELGQIDIADLGKGREVIYVARRRGQSVKDV